MFCRNLKYYRLKNRLTTEELAERIGIKSDCILRYEAGMEKPDFETVRKLSYGLGVNLSDFLISGGADVVICTEEDDFDAITSAFVQVSIEDYFDRFFTLLDILGVKMTRNPIPDIAYTSLSDSQEICRRIGLFIGIEQQDSPAGFLEILENSGILIVALEADPVFSGKSGTVNGFPFIALNSSLTNEQIVKVAAKELVSSLVSWDETLSKNEIETKKAEMINILISMLDVVDLQGNEEPTMFQELTIHAISQGIISRQRGAELLRVPYEMMDKLCVF
ncbi:MAG: helix-turn-helix domain-containing protein [Clostridia bacterium]|nr:helix-turn-helix domain-containing protein [Clostridia bacterium]